MIFSGTPAPTGNLSKRVMFGFALALSCWVHFGVLESVAYADQKGKSNACSGLENPLRSVEQALTKGDVVEAERLLLHLESSRPACGEVLAGLARVRASQKKVDAADQLFLRAVELSPDDPHTYFYFAQFSFDQGDYPRAYDLTEKALNLKNEYPEALILKGQMLAMSGEPGAARKTLEEVCRIAPKNAEAHFQLGVLFDNSKLNREAVEQFRISLALRLLDPRTYDYLGLNLEALGETQEAATVYKRGLLVNKGPHFDYFLDYNYGRFLLKERKLQESKVHLDRAVSLAPETRAVFYERGKLNMILGDYEQARRDAEQASRLPDPSGFVLDLQVYYLLATVYSHLGEDELARQYAELSKTAVVPIQDRARN
jgi:tetratricopeptide (TPR) repeat protein